MKKTKSQPRPSTVHSDDDANRDQPSNNAADTQAAATANPEPVDDKGLLKDLNSVNEVQWHEKKQDPTWDIIIECQFQTGNAHYLLPNSI